MNLRRARGGDREALRALRAELEAELGLGGSARSGGSGGLGASPEAGKAREIVVVAEEAGDLVGYAEIVVEPPQGVLTAIYVRPLWRRRGVARRLLSKAASLCRAFQVIALGVELPADGGEARRPFERLGFQPVSLRLSAALDDLEGRPAGALRKPSRGRVYVQTDDVVAVERAVRAYVPRLGRSQGATVSPPRGGWVEVEDELCSREPKLLRRLAQELSYRTGGVVLALGLEEGAVVRYVLFDRGSVADEYASLPEYYGPLPPGEVVALAANPRVAQRLTGADPERLRAAARTASRPEDLPPPEELYAQVARALGVAPG